MRRIDYAQLGVTTASLAANAVASSRLAKIDPNEDESERKKMLMIGLGAVGIGFAAQAALKDKNELVNLIGKCVEVGGGTLHALVAHQVVTSGKRS